MENNNIYEPIIYTKEEHDEAYETLGITTVKLLKLSPPI